MAELVGSRGKLAFVFALILALNACGFDGDELREYLPPEVMDATSLYNERDLLFCAVSIYQVPDQIDFEQLPLTEPNRSSTNWLQLPVNDAATVIEEDLTAQALFYGDECFDSEAKRITGLRNLSDYFSTERKGFFIGLRPDLILVHDLERSLIIISSRPR
ncbi:MAG: hypothetical protein ABJ327_26305 [Litoreibacter sp.]